MKPTKCKYRGSSRKLLGGEKIISKLTNGVRGGGFSSAPKSS